MVYIKRFFKFMSALLLLILIGCPCLIISILLAAPITIVLFLVNYMETRCARDSIHEALFTCFDNGVLEIGIAPFEWCLEIIKDF